MKDFLREVGYRTGIGFIVVGLLTLLSYALIGFESDYCITQDFLEAAQNVSNSHEYNRTGYNCRNFSIDLVAQLKEAGYDAEYCSGTYNGSPHGFVKVEVYIESTSGLIITPDRFNSDYTIKKCGDINGFKMPVLQATDN